MNKNKNQAVDLSRKPTEIKTSSRTIKIKYTTRNPLNSYERELLERHIKVHYMLGDLMESLEDIKNNIKILYKGDEKARKIFNDRKKQFSEILKATEKSRGKNDNNLEKALQSTVEKFNNLGEDFLKNQNEYGPIGQKTAKIVDDLFNNLNKLIENGQELAKYNNSIFQTKIENIDHTVYVTDFNKFNEALAKFSAEREKMIKDFEHLLYNIHNPLGQEVDAFKSEVMKQNEAVNNFVPDPKVKRMKVYELPANSEQMEKYSKMIDAASVRGNGLLINVAWTVIERCDANVILDIIRVSQHKEPWLRNMIYGISLVFPEIPISEPMGSDKNVFLSPMIAKWFVELAKFPMIYFFLRKDYGPHFLMADMIYGKMVEFKRNNSTNESFYGIMSDDIPALFDKLYDGCIRFMEFCYGTGVDPRPHIEFAIKATYDSMNLGKMLPPVTVFSYDDVVDDWKRVYNR